MKNNLPKNDYLIFTCTIDSTLDAVSSLCSDLQKIIMLRYSDEVKGLIDIGLTEALTNIVRHGYKGSSGHSISVNFFDYGDHCCIKIIDYGIPIPKQVLSAADGSVFDFDPLDISVIPSGGMGLSLINEIFDKVIYESEFKINTMTLIKNSESLTLQRGRY